MSQCENSIIVVPVKSLRTNGNIEITRCGIVQSCNGCQYSAGILLAGEYQHYEGPLMYIGAPCANHNNNNNNNNSSSIREQLQFVIY